MIFDRDVETRSAEEQRRSDQALYRKQIGYLLARSAFYRRKLADAGFKDAKSVGGLENIHNLPFTVKDEVRKNQADYPPLGDFLAADPQDVMRIYSTSGTTGTPVFIALTPRDMEVWATNTARSYTAGGGGAGRERKDGTARSRREDQGCDPAEPAGCDRSAPGALRHLAARRIQIEAR